MYFQRLEDIRAWQMARKLAQMVYRLTKKTEFSMDFALKNQIRAAAGSSMHNIAEGFDSDSHLEFIRFLRYAKRSCTEIQSELYVARDQGYISEEEFWAAYQSAARTRSAIGGLIASLKNNQNTKASRR